MRIRHHLGTHEEVGAALTADQNNMAQIESDLNGIANRMTAPKVWSGAAAEAFLHKHNTLMKDVNALIDAIKRLNEHRQSAYEEIMGMDDKVTRVFKG